MPIEMDFEKAICFRCGTAYGRCKGNFPVSYGALYKGKGYLPICKTCMETLYTEYLNKTGDAKQAVRMMCRKLDLYWNETIYDTVEKKSTSRTIMTSYLMRVNGIKYAGKCYDDTLREENTFLAFEVQRHPADTVQEHTPPEPAQTDPEDEDVVYLDTQPIEITDEIVQFWGQGLTPSMYRELEQRRRFYKEQMGDDTQLDMSTEMLLRQIAMAEIDINKARAAGVSVDKLMSSLNSMLSNLKKPQKSAATDAATGNTPFGVWIKRWEDERPIPEADEEFKDVDGIVKYVTVWLFGHLCKMLGVKNSYCKMYEDEIARLRVERPEYDDEDDDTMLNDMFGGVELENMQPSSAEDLDHLLYGDGGEPDGGTE